MACSQNYGSTTNQAGRDIKIDKQENKHVHSYHNTNCNDDNYRDCLRALRCANTFDVMNRLKENKDKVLFKSIEWFFQDPQYLRWRNEDDISLLWIKGGAGKGKTMMSIGLIDGIPRPRDNTTIMTYFFCRNDDVELNTIASVIKGLIFRLLDQNEQLKPSLVSRWDAAHERFDEDFTSWRTLWKIFLEMLDRCQCQRVYVVVDALDECEDEDMAGFLKLIVRTGLHSSKIKWLLTSRPLDVAEQELLAGADQAFVSFELNSEHIAEAVNAYITYKTTELARRQSYGPRLRQEVETELKTRAEETYLWVSLACKRLEDVRRDQALETIRELPPGLPAFYERIFDQLCRGEPGIVERCLRLLTVTLLAFRPLNVTEIRSMIGFSDQEGAIENLVDRCASLIKMRENRIEFVHQSARDFLTAKGEHSLPDFYDKYGHIDIALNCVAYLQDRLKVNVLDLPRPDSIRGSVNEPKDEGKTAILAGMNYAATFWVQHLKLAEDTPQIQNALSEPGEISQFLHSTLLEWLECLSLLDQLPHAIEAFTVVSEVASSSKQPHISMLMQDAMRFLRRHHHTIKTWPLQIYSSTIAFSPRASLVRTNNAGKMPLWLKNVPVVEDEWGSTIQTLVGHSDWVRAVAFSQDGKWIASGSDDETIKIWDSVTGDLKKTLVGHSDNVTAVVFSPDGRRVASGSRDKTIKLWNHITGDLKRTLESNSSIISIVYSPEGKWIASGSEDGTVEMWDVTTNHLERKLQGHLEMVNTIAFSPDGKRIASGSKDKTIKLWNSGTGRVEKTLEGHWNSVSSIAYSREWIASISSDGIVKLWDATTGNMNKTLQADVLYWTQGLAFSPDGQWIAYNSNDQTLKICDIFSSDKEKRLTGHSTSITSMAFSPDGKRIISGSRDRTIKIWDIPTTNSRMHRNHSDNVTAVAFSPNGKWITSQSLDRTVKIWDTTTGDLKGTVEDLLRDYVTTSFSPDSKWIAIGWDDGTIKVWNTTTNNVEKTLGELEDSSANQGGYCEALAFSPDSKRIASEHSDRAIGLVRCFIRIWDIATSDLQNTLNYSTSRWVGSRAITFSPDGKQIASAFEDNIRICDIKTGKLEGTLSGYSGWVSAIAFSPDGKWIALGYTLRTIGLYKVRKSSKVPELLSKAMFSYYGAWKCCSKIMVPGPVKNLRFSADSQHLLTNVGSFLVQNILTQKKEGFLKPLQHLYFEDQWLHCGAMRILRLRPDSEPKCFDNYGNWIVIGFSDGRVQHLHIDLPLLRSTLGVD